MNIWKKRGNNLRTRLKDGRKFEKFEALRKTCKKLYFLSYAVAECHAWVQLNSYFNGNSLHKAPMDLHMTKTVSKKLY